MESISILEVLGYVGFGALGLAAFSALIVLGLSVIAAHTVILLGHRITDNGLGQKLDAIWYRFAIQNAEDVPLDAARLGVAKLQLKLKVDGKFLTPGELERCREAAANDSVWPQGPRGRTGLSNPALFAGPHSTPLSAPSGGSTYQVEFSELPAYDTWVIEFWTDPSSRNVSLEIEELDADGLRIERHISRIRPTRLVLDSSRDIAVRGNLRTPSIGFGVAAIGLTSLGYLVLARWQAELPWTWAVPFGLAVDIPIALVLGAIATVMFVKFRRPTPMIAQGYLEETPMRPGLPAAPGS